MLNEFGGIQKVSDESLGRDETPRHTSHKIYILHMYWTIFYCIYEKYIQNTHTLSAMQKLEIVKKLVIFLMSQKS